jgi:CBS domain-containing protein
MKRHIVADVMTSPASSVAESTTYHDIIDVMVAHNISAVPVVDANGSVVGVVSEADLLHKMEFAGSGPARRLIERKRVRDGRRKAAATVAADLMSEPPIVIGRTASIATAAALMSEHGVKRLPVVDGRDRLIGVVSRADLVRLYARPDDQILSDIREYVLRRTMAMDPDALTVGVRDGVAMLAGAVDRRSTITVIELLVQTVPGVVDVANHLSYHFDDQHRPIVLPAG